MNYILQFFSHLREEPLLTHQIDLTAERRDFLLDFPVYRPSAAPTGLRAVDVSDANLLG